MKFKNIIFKDNIDIISILKHIKAVISVTVFSLTFIRKQVTSDY